MFSGHCSIGAGRCPMSLGSIYRLQRSRWTNSLSWRERQLRYTQLSNLLEKGHEKFSTLTRKALMHTSNHFSLKLEKTALEALEQVWFNLKPFPEVEEVLRELKKSYKLVVLSNGDRDQLKKATRVMKVPFDLIVSAEMSRAYKPSPRIYSMALKLLKLKSSKVLHVAGNQNDVLGAGSAGLKTVWVNRKKEQLDESGRKPDYETVDFKELISKVGL